MHCTPSWLSRPAPYLIVFPVFPLSPFLILLGLVFHFDKISTMSLFNKTLNKTLRRCRPRLPNRSRFHWHHLDIRHYHVALPVGQQKPVLPLWPRRPLDAAALGKCDVGCSSSKSEPSTAWQSRLPPSCSMLARPSTARHRDIISTGNDSGTPVELWARFCACWRWGHVKRPKMHPVGQVELVFCHSLLTPSEAPRGSRDSRDTLMNSAPCRLWRPAPLISWRRCSAFRNKTTRWGTPCLPSARIRLGQRYSTNCRFSISLVSKPRRAVDA